MGPTYVHVSQWEEGRWKGLLMDEGAKKSAYQIILTLDFNPLLSEGSVSVKLVLILDHGMAK